MRGTNLEGTQVAINGRLERDNTIKRSIIRSDCLHKGETSEIWISVLSKKESCNKTMEREMNGLWHDLVQDHAGSP